ncbi:MAG: ribonuclease PH [Acidobacteria bacterium]|nr:ribonuclease PH [Acidobacteriota bacterium]
MNDERVERIDGRAFDELRPVILNPGFIKNAEGSCLIEAGDTKVICTASIEERVPSFLHRTGKGWITAEYGMLPRATNERTQREASRGKQGGRTLEIQRLIGRSLRAAVDFEALGERTVWIDCDVIQADGGTRTASITGGFVALVMALGNHYLEERILAWPLSRWIAAVSVGIVGGVPMLDLIYREDSKADVDMNIVATDNDQFVEIQGSAEGRTFSQEESEAMLKLARTGIAALSAAQHEVLDPIIEKVNKLSMSRLNKRFR